MPFSAEDRDALLKFTKKNAIKVTHIAPKTFTSNIKDNTTPLVIRVNHPEQLKTIVEEIDRMNQTRSADEKIISSVIGGGRAGDNDSYSISNLWQGADVLIQLAWEPTIKLIETIETIEIKQQPQSMETVESAKNQKNVTREAIVRVSGNTMLIELNKMLYQLGYYAPSLCGTLPFMSIAGGLSTNCHTSYGYLADMVEGVNLLLPNGQEKYIGKHDPDFKLVCNSPTLGLLGTIVSLDIKVKEGKKKLKREVTITDFDAFKGNDFKPKLPKPDQDYAPRAVIFSPVGLSKKTPVKTTTWKWVDAGENDRGVVKKQHADRTPFATDFLPWLATKHPRTYTTLFETTMMSKSQQGTVISKPDAIMGPESKLIGEITEIGLFFNYDADKTPLVLERIVELLERKRAQNRFPINTAIFIRFPQHGNGHRVAIDFASLGLNLKGLHNFVVELKGYLESQEIDAKLHYGKSYGMQLNQSGDEWKVLKSAYEKFYTDNDLDLALLNKKITLLAETKQAAPKVPTRSDNLFGTVTLNKSNAKDEDNICGEYRLLCKEYKERLENELNVKYKINDFTNIDSIEKTSNRLKDTIEKYKIILSLEETLGKPNTPHITNTQKIEAFHRRLDQNRKKLSAQRDITIFKWLGVFTAAVAGLGIFSYWTGKAAKDNLFTTKAESMLINKVDKIRDNRNKKSIK